MKELTNDLKESKNYTDNIMDSIMSVLTKKKIDFTSNSKKTELIINSDNIEKIEKLLFTNGEIPNMVFKLLVDVVKVNDKIYIRQKVK